MSKIDELISVMEANGRKMDKLITLFEKDKSEWLSGEEACKALGISIKSSGSNKRRLQYLREHGLLTRFGQLRPYTYCKKEVQEVADKIRRNEIHVLGMGMYS